MIGKICAGVAQAGGRAWGAARVPQGEVREAAIFDNLPKPLYNILKMRF